MATVSGGLQDFGYSPVGNNPVLRFVPTQASGRGSYIFADKPVYASVSDSGIFTVELQATQELPGKVFYRIEAIWMDSRQNITDRAWWGELTVPVGGGSIGDLIGANLPNDLVYAGDDAVSSEKITQFQVNTTTWDVYERQK